MLHYRAFFSLWEIAQITEQNSEKHVGETSAPSLSTVAERDVSAPEASHDSPLPSLAGADVTPAHLASLADRARGYVQRPVPPTRARPTRPTGSIFRRGAGAPIWPPCPRIRKPSDFTSQLALLARLNGVQKRTLSRPSNAASPRSPGTMLSVASRSIARTDISPP